MGCVISTGSVDCNECDESPLCHNHVANGECFCDANYTWEDPDDDGNLNCERIPAKGGGSDGCPDANSSQSGTQCYCDPGYAWCSNDANDLSCCVDDAQDAAEGTATDSVGGTDTVADTGDTGTLDDTGTGDTGTGGPTGQEPDPADCTPDAEGQFFCSNADIDNVEGSRLWTCQSGTWVEGLEPGDADCQFNQFDFAYGCFDNAEAQLVEFVCGVGPGTDCTPADDTCVDAEVLQFCDLGKLAEENCLVTCTEIGIDGVTFDHGECITDPVIDCLCCDEPVDGACPAR
jgi:hypothetical protein